MAKIYFYKLTVDAGAAPCIKNGILSLAICKPMLRKTAVAGDLIFGFAANSLHRDNRLIYLARVTRALRNGEYFRSSRYTKRGDCIYRFRSGEFVWRKGARYHGPNDLVHDLGAFPEYPRANVLLSTDFRYFGLAGSDKYKSKFPRVRDAVESLGRGQRVWHGPALRSDLLAMADWLWRTTRSKVAGRPTSAPIRSACYRGKSCAVL